MNIELDFLQEKGKNHGTEQVFWIMDFISFLQQPNIAVVYVTHLYARVSELATVIIDPNLLRMLDFGTWSESKRPLFSCAVHFICLLLS